MVILWVNIRVRSPPSWNSVFETTWLRFSSWLRFRTRARNPVGPRPGECPFKRRVKSYRPTSMAPTSKLHFYQAFIWNKWKERVKQVWPVLKLKFICTMRKKSRYFIKLSKYHRDLYWIRTWICVPITLASQWLGFCVENSLFMWCFACIKRKHTVWKTRSLGQPEIHCSQSERRVALRNPHKSCDVAFFAHLWRFPHTVAHHSDSENKTTLQHKFWAQIIPSHLPLTRVNTAVTWMKEIFLLPWKSWLLERVGWENPG